LEIDLQTRRSTKADAFVITIGTESLRDREPAGSKLNQVAEKHYFTEKLVKVGSFAGFPIEIWPNRVKELIVRGKNAYVASISDTPLGTISSLEYAVRSLEAQRITYGETLTSTQRRIEELKPHTHKPFPHDEKLRSLVARQQEIVQALDLNKNQASNQLEAEPTVVIEETPVESVKASARAALSV
jgi:hypothetical protein